MALRDAGDEEALLLFADGDVDFSVWEQLDAQLERGEERVVCANVTVEANGDWSTEGPSTVGFTASTARKSYAVLKPAPACVASAHVAMDVTPCAASSAVVSAEHATTRPRPAAATQILAPKARKRTKDEIESLRQSVTNLEAQLRRLRYEDSSETATVASSLA